ncbi:MAG: AAA family ATPase [Pasteurella sp.]|nr:AAA family ATPase [Pasteurella sp.]
MSTNNKLKHISYYASQLPKKDVIETKLLPAITEPQTLTVVVAGRKNGKTSLLTQIAVKVARQNNTVAFFTTQETGQHFCQRLRYYLSLDDMAKLPIFIGNDYAVTEQSQALLITHSIRQQCNDLMKQQGAIGMIIIDDLALFDCPKNANAEPIAKALKQIAIDFNCAVVISSNCKKPLRMGGGSKITDITNNNSFIAEIADNLLMLEVQNNIYSSHLSTSCKTPAKMSIRVATQLPLLSSFVLEV